MTEMMICNEVKRCSHLTCRGKTKHSNLGLCSIGCPGNNGGIKGATCVPYLSEICDHASKHCGTCPSAKANTDGLPQGTHCDWVGADVKGIPYFEKEAEMIPSEYESWPGEDRCRNCDSPYGDHYGAFCYQTREEEEAEMKYEQTDKALSRMSVWEAMTSKEKKCEEALAIYKSFDGRFKSYFAWDQSIPYSETTFTLAEFFKDHPKALQWCVNNGFIREVVPEVFYSIGDRFKLDKCDYLLAQTDQDFKVNLIGLDDGIRWRDPRKVSDPYKITWNEFEIIAGHRILEFTKIEK